MALPNFNRNKAAVKVPKGQVVKYKKDQGYYTAPKVVVKKKVDPGTVTQDQIVKTARARAQATLNAAKAPVLARGTQLGKQELGASQGLSSVLSDVSQRIQDLYGGAAKETAALGQGYSGALRDTLAQADAATQAKLAEMGLPSPGAAPVDAAANVTYGLGGALPAANLTKQGAGYASAAAFLPATTRMQGLAQKATTDRATQQQLADLQAKYPDIFQSYLTDERNWKNSQFDNYVNYLNTQGGGGGNTARPKISIRPDGTILSIDPYTGVPTVTGQTSPSSTTPVTGPGSKAATARTKAVTKRNDDVTKQAQKVTEWLNKALSKKPVQTGSKTISVGGVSKTTPIYKAAAKPTYRVAFNYMFNQLWLSLKRYGYNKSDIRQMVTQILDAHNLHPEVAGPPNPVAPADRPVR